MAGGSGRQLGSVLEPSSGGAVPRDRCDVRGVECRDSAQHRCMLAVLGANKARHEYLVLLGRELGQISVEQLVEHPINQLRQLVGAEPRSRPGEGRHRGLDRRRLTRTHVLILPLCWAYVNSWTRL
jgi:hypothetical protein